MLGRRPRGVGGGAARQAQQIGGASSAQPHASWWGEEGIPRVGGAVQVLHEDGVWYPGRLGECEGGKWHIKFEDGDEDAYTLPHRYTQTSSCLHCPQCGAISRRLNRIGANLVI